MASDESMTITPNSSIYSSMQDIDLAGYLDDDYSDDDPHQLNAMSDDDDDEDEGDEEAGDDHMGLRMSRLFLETSEGDDAIAELSDHVDDKEKEEQEGLDVDCDDDGDDGGISTSGFAGGFNYFSLPGTPNRCTPRRRAGSTHSSWMKKYASETEATLCRHGGRARKKVGAAVSDISSYHQRIRSRKTRQRRLDRAWEMKRCHWAGSDGPDSHSGGSSPCVVVRPTGQGASCMWMDMEEVKACRDLGLELPCDWTVEIPPGAFTAAVTADAGGGDSPVNNWRLSHPAEDPRDMKARLRVWAQAVALASASRLSC